MTKTINQTELALETVKALREAGFRIDAKLNHAVTHVQVDSLTYAEDIIEELGLEVGHRVDNTFDHHILYLDNHNKAVAKYNYDTGILLLSNTRNADAYAAYCMNTQHDGLEVFDSPFAVLSAISKMCR